MNWSTFNGGLDVNNSANVLSVTNVISGSGSLTKLGAGMLMLLNTNTFSGGTVISLGILEADYTNAVGTGLLTLNGGTLSNSVTCSLTNPVNLSANSTVASSATLTLSGAITNAGSLTKTGAGTVILTGNNTYTNATTISAGTLQIGDGTADGNLASSSSVTNNGALVYNLVGSQAYGNVIRGTGSLTKSGTGTLRLSAINTFSGGTTVSGGTLILTNVSDCAVKSPLTVNSGGTLTVAGDTFMGFGTAGTNINITGGTVNAVVSEPFINNGVLNMTGGTLGPSANEWCLNNVSINTLASASTATISGVLFIRNDYAPSAPLTFTVASGSASPDLLVSGYIKQAAAGANVIKNGLGKMVLSNVNTYSGKTTMNAGALALSGAGSIATSTNIIIAGGATFDVSAKSSAFTLGSSQTISNSSVGAIINGTNNCSAGTLSLVYDGVNPSFTITNGGMTISASTTFNVNNTGTALTAGSYKLIAKATAGTVGLVAGTVPSVTLGGSGKASGTGTSVLRISSGELYLDVPPTALTLGNDGPICAGNTLHLTANTVSGGTYAWTGPNGFSSSSQNPSIANATTAASGTYHCTVTVNGVTSADATTNATVNALPTPTAGNNGPVCVGTSLSLTSSGGVGYTWSGPNGFSLTTQNPTVSASATLAMAGTYTVIVTNASGCTASTTTTVAVNALPTTSAITGTNSVQQLTSATYSVVNTAGSTYGWTVPAGASFTGGTANSINVTFGSTSGNVSVIETNSSGCTGTPQSLFVTVITCTAPTIVGGIDGAGSAYCEGSQVVLTLTNITSSYTPLSYQWQTNGVNILNATNASYTNSALTLANTNWTYTVIVTNACGLTATSGGAKLAANAAPTTSGISGTTPVIHASTHTYSVTATAGSTYGWTMPTGATFTGGTGNSINVTFGTTSGNVLVIETNSSGCTGSQQTLVVTVSANNAPTAYVMNVLRTPGEPVLIALSDLATNWNDLDGDTVQMTAYGATTTNGVSLTPLNLTTDGGGYVTTNIAFLGYTNTAPPDTNLNDQFTYTISDGYGGTASGTVNIVVQPFVGGQVISGQQTTNNISGSTFTVTYYGIPGYTYLLERSTNLFTGALWVDIATNTIGAGGVTNVIDSFSDIPGGHPSSAYYRVGWKTSY